MTSINIAASQSPGAAGVAANARLFWLASLLFFCSGATGLAYEVIWFKRFAHVWGSSALAMACVVASFLAGLGAGAHVLGRVADRVRTPLFWYGVLEILIGVLAGAALVEIDWLLPFAAGLYPRLHEQVVLFSLVRFVLSLLILGPICFMMGGTLPLLVRQFTPPESALKESTGWLYAINTLGAAAGCYLAGFHLLPAFGLGATNAGIVAANLIIGMAAIALAGSLPGSSGAPAHLSRAGPPVAEPRAPRGGLSMIYAVAAVTGCASLMLQMVWARQSALILGGSTYVFTAILCVFLVGIGVGSLVFDRWLKRYADAEHLPLILIVALVLSATAGKLGVPALSSIAGIFRMERGWRPFDIGLSLFVSGALQFLPTLAMGVLFPLLVHLTRRTAAQAGRAVGSVYALNTVGSIVGAQVTSMFLIPAIGLDATAAAALGAYAVCALLLATNTSLRDTLILAAGLVACGYAVRQAARMPDPRRTNFGMFLYGYSPTEKLLTEVQLRYFREGPTCNVMVTDLGQERALRVNGKVDASRGIDMTMQLGLAYFPRFLHPQARDVVTIGFGSGATVGAALLFPGTHVTCCEIEPAVVGAAELFADVNHQPLLNPNLTVVYDDGRNHLQGTAARYDLILSEPSNPWMAGVSNLFTREFYRAAAEKLNDGGLLAQWVQLYNSTPDDYAMIVRTLSEVFPHNALVRISLGDTILLASRTPLDLSNQTVTAAQSLVDANPAVQRDLQRYYGSADVRALLLGKILLDRDGLERFSRGARINTDFNARLEFDAPRRLFSTAPHQLMLVQQLAAAADPDWPTRQFAAWGCGPFQVGGLRDRANALREHQQPAAALAVLDFALGIAPDTPELLADKLVLAADLPDEEFARLARRLVERSVRDATRAGGQLLRAGRAPRAVAIQRFAVELHPESPSSWLALAAAHSAAGERDAALEAYRTALELDPVNAAAIEAYERLKAAPPSAPGGV